MTKSETVEKAQTLVEEEKKKDWQKLRKIANNWTTVSSVIVILLTIIQYSYKSGICKVFGLPYSVITIRITDYIPIVSFLCSVAFLTVYYCISLKVDKITKRKNVNFLRIFWGAIIIFLAFNAMIQVGKEKLVLYGVISLGLSCIIEFILRFRIKRADKKEQDLDVKTSQLVLTACLEDLFYYHYFLKTGLVLIVIVVILSPIVSKDLTKYNKCYEVCSFEGVNHAVIFDYADRVLVQPVEYDKGTLVIYTDYYRYIPKEKIERFEYRIFDNIVITRNDEDDAIVGENNEEKPVIEAINEQEIEVKDETAMERERKDQTDDHRGHETGDYTAGGGDQEVQEVF